jgi:threonine aldolase
MIVDLRSDTVTRPTPEMYDAMRNAPLGDDVLGDEPTVTALEQLSSEMMGKDEAVFVPSGTMGNQIALLSWLSPGDGFLIEQDAHILYYESGGPAAHSGAVSWTLPSKNGVMDPEYVRSRILTDSIHTPGTKLICLENTHNRAGGTIVPQTYMEAFRSVADDHAIRIHLDGARVFNAAVAQGVPVAEIARYADSVTFCLSKGLSCPIGSVLAGPSQFIQRARQNRKRLGGGMRQAGILAACGIYALQYLVDRLAEDHSRAARLATEINDLPGLGVDLETVQTNMVIVRTEAPANEWQSRLEERGVRCFSVDANRLRLVTHREVDDEQIGYAAGVFAELAAN